MNLHLICRGTFRSTGREYTFTCTYPQVRIQRGGGGGLDPSPGKSQVMWVSIGNKPLDPTLLKKVGPPPWKILDPPPPPPPPEYVGPPSGTFKNDCFL